MCGKFTQMFTWAEVHDFSSPILIPGGQEEDILTATPMRMARVIIRGETGLRESLAMRWGFSKQSAQSPARPDHMHARAETIDTRPTFAHAFAHHRGILLVRTFNEGEELESGKTKQWVITPKDRAPLAIAVICERWTNAAQSLWTFVMATVPPNPLIARITDRMPAMLQPEDWPLWLGECEAPLSEVKALLRTHDDAGAWDMAPQAPPSSKAAKSRAQGDLI